MVRAISIDPEPQEPEPLLESGTADAGAEAFGEGTVGIGGSWMAGGVDEEASREGAGFVSGVDIVGGLMAACGRTAGAGARPGKYASSRCVPNGVPGKLKTRTGRSCARRRNTPAATA